MEVQWLALSPHSKQSWVQIPAPKGWIRPETVQMVSFEGGQVTLCSCASSLWLLIFIYRAFLSSQGIYRDILTPLFALLPFSERSWSSTCIFVMLLQAAFCIVIFYTLCSTSCFPIHSVGWPKSPFAVIKETRINEYMINAFMLCKTMYLNILYNACRLWIYRNPYFYTHFNRSW